MLDVNATLILQNYKRCSKSQEKDVDKHFIHFEKLAQNLSWPKKQLFRLLLQSAYLTVSGLVFFVISRINNHINSWHIRISLKHPHCLDFSTVYFMTLSLILNKLRFAFCCCIIQSLNR